MNGTIPRGAGMPPHRGLYAVEVRTGWRLLEWHDGWWFPERTARWGADVPAQWAGPLPRLTYADPPKPVFDL